MNNTNLYEKDLYLNKNIECLINYGIYEYDIKQAGYNITKYYNLLPKDKINILTALSKENKHVKIGLYQRNDKAYRDSLKQGFKDIRKEFFEANDIDDSDILSIKKDAIFLTKAVKQTQFKNIEFVKKNKYTSYYYLNGMEYYYNSKDDIIHVKGIDDLKLKCHKKYMLSALQDIFKLQENNTKDAVEFLIDFANDYKRKELPIEFYRELNPISCFKTDILLNNENQVLYFNDLSEDTEIYSDHIDISFNYLNVLMPLVGITF